MLKKITILTLAFIGCIAMNAQTTIYQDNFETASLDGFVGSIPSEFSIYNEDGLTPVNASPYSFIDEAWKIINYEGYGKAATSTSNYVGGGQADDWLVTPQISIPSSFSNLSLFYKVAGFNANATDDYEVLISTTGNSPEDFSDAPVFSENSIGSGELLQRSISLDDFAGDDIYIAFRNTASTVNLLIIKDIEVRDISNVDVAVNNVKLDNYISTGTDQSINVEISNNGLNPITSTTVEWTDGENTYSQDFTDLNIESFSSTSVDLETPVNYSDVVRKNITITALNPNETEDGNASNNSISTTIHTIAEDVEKAVVIEEGTGTWCGFCPRGIVAMEYMYGNPEMFPNFIGIAVHNDDPMLLPEYDTGAAFSGFPGSNVDRVLKDQSVSSAAWTDYYNDRKDVVTPANINIEATYNEESRNLTATINSNFYTFFENEDALRLSLVIVEDGVSGTSAGYAQRNYYAGGSQGPLNGFENEPDPIPASDIVYDRVGKALLGGYNGEAGSVPDVINNGDSFSYVFNYTLPSDMNVEEVSVVALLIDQETGAILNASEFPVGTLGVSNVEASNNFKLYPNPASNYVNVDFSKNINSQVEMAIYSMNGELIKTRQFERLTTSDSVKINVNSLSSGAYLLSFSTDKGSFTKKLVVK